MGRLRSRDADKPRRSCANTFRTCARALSSEASNAYTVAGCGSFTGSRNGIMFRSFAPTISIG